MVSNWWYSWLAMLVSLFGLPWWHSELVARQCRNVVFDCILPILVILSTQRGCLTWKLRWRFQQKCFPSIVGVGVKNSHQASVPRCHLMASGWRNLACCRDMFDFLLLVAFNVFNGLHLSEMIHELLYSCIQSCTRYGHGFSFQILFDCIFSYPIPSLVCWVTLWWILTLSQCKWKWPMFCIPFHLVLKPCLSETV
jgi:hypothetical protein